jgi:hypothetical protein
MTRSITFNEFPKIGQLTWWDRLKGWDDLHCRSCGAIVGSYKSTSNTTVWCGDCSSIYALVGIL